MSPRSSAEGARQTRAAILDHAVKRGSIDGLQALTIGTLADELGLSKAGVVGPFGSKEQLQLATFAHGAELFRASVWAPAEHLPAGSERLRAVCVNWIGYLWRRELPGGCLVTTASVEFDARAGPLHDAVARTQDLWLRTLAADAEVAVRARELPQGTDPQQVAFELNGIAMSANMAILLFDDRQAARRARRAIDRILALGA